MKTRDYLTIPEGLNLHTILIKRYGGANDIHDFGALEASALMYIYAEMIKLQIQHNPT